ncbi:MAG TPA: hypothetical protein VF002_02895 [Gaiellaceae bacterium]
MKRDEQLTAFAGKQPSAELLAMCVIAPSLMSLLDPGRQRIVTR